MVRVLRVGAILFGGAILGLAWNGLSGRGLALDRHVFIQEGEEVVEVAEARARLDRGALFLDARPRMFYEMEHIPGAEAMPEDEFEAAFAALEPQLRESLDVVVYCSGYGCEASHIVARQLRERGIPAVVLHDGWPAWLEAGHPVVRPEGG